VHAVPDSDTLVHVMGDRDGGGELEHVQGHGTGVLVGLDLSYTGRVHFSGH